MNESSLWVKLASIALLGCAPVGEVVDSDDVRTSGYYAEFSAEAFGDGTTIVRAWLRVGGQTSNTFAELDGDDELIAWSDADNRIMHRTGSAPGTPYQALFPHEDQSQIRVSFERGELDVSAPDSEVLLPKPFAPSFRDFEEGDDWPRDQDLVVQWETHDTMPMHWTLLGTCTTVVDDTKQRTATLVGSGSTKDARSLTIRAEQIDLIVPVGARNEEEELLARERALRSRCDTSIKLRRNSKGNVDAAYREGGTFGAAQERAVYFQSVPGAPLE